MALVVRDRPLSGRPPRKYDRTRRVRRTPSMLDLPWNPEALVTQRLEVVPFWL